MLREITWRELQELYAYSIIEPFGEEREDLRAGIVASAIVNIITQVNSDPKKGRPKLTRPIDFMHNFDELSERQERRIAAEPVGQGAWQRFKAGLIKAAKAE